MRKVSVHFRLETSVLCKMLGLMLLVLSLALPVCAQGQSPSSPRPRPGGSSLDENAANGNNQNANQQDDSRERQSLRERREEQGERLREREGGDEKEADKKPEEGDKGPTTIDQGQLPTAEGGEGANVMTRTGKAGKEGAPGKPKPGAPAGQKAAKGGASVSVIGSEPFDPAYEREIAYPEIPDEGVVIKNLEGPMDLQEFLTTISLSANWGVVVSPKIKETALGYFSFPEVRAAKALELLKLYEIYYEFDDATKVLYVRSLREVQEEEYGELIQKEFIVKNADIPYVESVLATVVSPKGRVITDQRTGHIYVWDTKDNLDHMEQMVEELDVPLQKRDFLIQYADLADVQTVLTSMLSANGKLVADPRTGQIFVWDSPANLTLMAAAVERLDVPVETLTIPMEYVNATDVTDNLEALMSEKGLIQVDPRTNSLVITDIPARVERMASLIDTLDIKLDTRAWVLNYADEEFVADQLEAYIPEEMGTVVVNEDLHQITVTGLAARLDEIDALIKKWDKKRPQVHIQAFIVEVGTEVEREFNINWSYFGTQGNVPLVVHGGDGATGLAEAPGDGQNMSIGQLPYAVPLYGALQLDGNGNIERPILQDINGNTLIDHFGGNNLAVALDYLDKQEKATILASPSIRVNDNEEAIFENATRVPYVSATTFFGGFNNNNNNVNNGFNNTNRIDFIDVGTILSVLPRINEEKAIVLEIDAEDSTFVMRNILSNGETSTIPEKTMRRAQTELRVNSGETVVLGGLRRDRAANNTEKTPLLGDLPVVGRLFRNPARSSSNNTLLIFMTTTLVEGDTDPESRMLTDAEQDIADQVRHNQKNIWGRMIDRVSGGANELGVSIGEEGALYSEGELIKLDDLQAAFADAPPGVKIVIRPHPGAPRKVVEAVESAAKAEKLPVEFDRELVPLVPDYWSVEETLEPLEAPAPPVVVPDLPADPPKP